ncbi:MAG TPA: hypothetical protein VEA38_07805 [Terriglobales bacterium]|nr:hypothetical protein [Terriglobales bacterium]
MTATRETATWLAQLLAYEAGPIDALTDGASAFQRVWEVDYDVIVAELGVPGIDGGDLYMAFQNTWPELTRRMVFVCGDLTPARSEFVTRTGVPLVRGPVSLIELREAISAVRAAPRPRALAS